MIVCHICQAPAEYICAIGEHHVCKRCRGSYYELLNGFICTACADLSHHFHVAWAIKGVVHQEPRDFRTEVKARNWAGDHILSHCFTFDVLPCFELHRQADLHEIALEKCLLDLSAFVHMHFLPHELRGTKVERVLRLAGRLLGGSDDTLVPKNPGTTDL